MSEEDAATVVAAMILSAKTPAETLQIQEAVTTKLAHLDAISLFDKAKDLISSPPKDQFHSLLPASQYSHCFASPSLH
jgi:hypothetical protein